MIELFDTHAHYDDERFDDDRSELLTSLKDKKIKYVLNAGTNYETSRFSINLANEYEFVFAACGIHPHEATDDIKKIEEIKSLILSSIGVKSVGEIGLDYYYDTNPRDVQKLCFNRQIELANELDLPIIIHDRDAHSDTMDIIKNHKGTRGVFHSFQGSVEMVKEVLKLGYYISFGGICTFKNARKSIEVIKYAPLDRILIETDSPYLTPVPHRGKRNDSSYVIHVAQKVAEIKK